jgi:hypothetical protein
MAEQTFRSPGFFEREIDVAPVVQGPTGTPAGIIGTSEKGPAFVPVTIGTFEDFRTRFGGVDPEKFGPYAVREFLKHRNALTYLRVLGAGANDSLDDMTTTKTKGTVKNAGFRVNSKVEPGQDSRHGGTVQFIAARHYVSASESITLPMFTDNSSFDTGLWAEPEYVNLVRGMILTPSGTRIMLLDGSGQATPAHSGWLALNDSARIIRTGDNKGLFKLVISSSAGADFAVTDSKKGIKILSCSLNPSDPNYLANILNTDPGSFMKEQHLLYAHFPVDPELAKVAGGSNDVAILSGSASTTSDGGDTSTAFRNLYGRYDTRFASPTTPAIISQMFGGTEYDLFHFETISDGAWGNQRYKLSIRNLRKSDDPRNLYGTFTVEIRNFTDTDAAPEVIESYPECNLNPRSERYVAAVIGDMKAYYNFDAEDEEERRIIVDGKYPNKSTSVRVVMNDAVESGMVPASALPFGFRGMELLKTSDTLTDTSTALPGYGSAKAGPPATQKRRLAMSIAQCGLSGSILPPIPLRFKVTKGEYSNTNDDGVPGLPGKNEVADSRFYWGVQFERVPETGSISNASFKPNNGSQRNELLENYAKFMGIRKLDMLVTGSSADAFCDNKFTLAKVAFGNFVGASQKVTTVLVSNFTASAGQHMRGAAYLRNVTPDPSNYLAKDSSGKLRVTLGTLVNLTASVYFNRFTSWAKFSTFFYGGFDGLNILDVNAKKMNDRSASTDTNGGANTSFVSPGLVDTSGNAKNIAGTGKDNNAVASYRTAVKIMTDEMTVNTNILALPGIRDAFITDYAAQRSRDYSMLMYLMDLIEYDEDGNRLFDDSTAKPDVQKTAEEFGSRAIDNSYSATYFPDVFIDDPYNRRKVKVPPSVPAIAALAYNDKVAYPWFAPAGFNRAALDMVSNVDVRLNAGDRDELYDTRINPIATFPREGYVIFGQKTLQASKSALDRVNVRRLMLEVKRIISNIANRFVFEQNTPETRSRFVGQVVPLLALVQVQAGIEKFSVVMDDTNNTAEDVSANRLNGRIVVVPTRTVEFISVDFIVDTTGASFV